MLRTNILALGLLLVLVSNPVSASGAGLANFSEELKTFLGTLERYANAENDVVFLLDESGSIGADKFPEVKLFAKLVSQRLSVSADHSRVAVVTFADETDTHVNYIEDPYGNNMCSLLVAIDKIGYKALWTHTDLAMKEAERILAQSRPGANKIIVLLTDGESNDGHSPVGIANRLKQDGVIIFAVGVAKVNVAEINAVATALNHTYILDDFKLIVDINKYLVNDTKEIKMDPARDSSYCNALCDDKKDCCGMHASCYCGTRTGNYECACQAGYHGKSGLKRHCKKCPRGTYKSEALNKECTPCPQHATTDKEGSTSFLDCKCETGYEKIGNFCLPVRCASLSVPEGGILIPTHCNNTFGTQCQMKCKEGYCPFSCNELDDNLRKGDQVQILPTRTCLESKLWSGQEFHCEKRTCPSLRYPQNGKHNCSENDFTFGTVCSFHCNKGYELFGSEFRTCMINSWTGNEATCREKFCKPLKTNDLLHVKRTQCSTNPMPYKSVCQYHCSNGYILVRQGNKTDGVLTCGDNRKWIGGYDDITCLDNEPPKIQCPNSTKVDAEAHKGYEHVKWDFPKATDNVPGTVTSIQIIEPKVLTKSPYFKDGTPAYVFPIGTTKVVYEATDRAQLTSTCSFTVEVLDKEPPKSVYCPEDIEIFHNTRNAIPVEWKEPIFEDNSKKFTVECSRKSGDSFSWGPAVAVHCVATDKSNNTASCKFSVKIKQYQCPFYDPPANGVLTCDTWIEGKMCSVFCHEGYQFVTGHKFERNYICMQVPRRDGKIEVQWRLLKTRNAAKMPWPDCSKIQKPTAISTTVGIKIGVDSCSEESLEKFREKFFSIELFSKDVFCPKDKGCKPENINITCNPVSTRSARSVRNGGLYKHRRDLPMQVLTINFNVNLLPKATEGDVPIITTNETEGESKIDLSSNPFMKELETEIMDNVRNAYNVSSNSEPKVEYNAVVVCSVGQIRVNNSCVNCPVGTYKDDVSETCTACPSATFQDEESQLSCKPCPVGFTTHQIKSKSSNDCKGPCQPGTYSETTFEPCLACPLNTYQDKAGRSHCLKCPRGFYTWRVGADALNDCVSPCKPGTFSDTGYQPCNLCGIGTFQDKARQTNCTICPDRTNTKSKGAKRLEDCEEFDICTELNPCQYNSTCIQRDKDYDCLCPDGLRGRNCEINVDDCESDPCLNNGTCIDGVRNFTCLCPEGWTGHQCQINIDDCSPNSCLNGGKCVDKVNAFECECLAGFGGKLCERNIYECESNPCHNGGTCFDKQNGYRCCCPKDFNGPNCETEVKTNACDAVVCHNGGTCSGDEDVYNCTCPPGFGGDLCEIDVDDCQYHECLNGGVCVDGVRNATCTCPDRYTGPHCEGELLLEYSLSFPTVSTTSYVELKNTRRLYAVTLSFFMRTSFKDPNSHATPVSYSYKYRDHLVDNALTLFDTNNFILYLHGEALHTRFSGNSDSSWHHYAITWEKLGGKWSFFVDGGSVASGENVGENKYMHPGTFVLGQEQDDVGSMFSMLEAFVGDITEFNVWDYAMTADEIREISSSCGYVGNVIPWYTVSQYASGDVKIDENSDKCKTIGHCSSDKCNCLKVDAFEDADIPCKNKVPACTTNTCANDQPCSTVEGHSFCDCNEGFEGRRCEYDINECLDQNGGCDFICVNDIGTGSYHCECPEDMVLSEDEKMCKDTGYCVKDGQTYMNEETWISNCQNCVCDKGIVKCSDIPCNETACQPEETLIINPGDCCPKCVAWSFCVISPNSTIMSFDMSKYQIEGGCNYTALEDCIDGRFKVQVEFATNHTSIVVHQDCSTLTISSGGDVFIDDEVVVPPFENGLWNVKSANTSVSVKTNSDLILEWDMWNDAVVAVPITHQSKMCGLCSKLEEYYVYDTGKFSLSDRWATGENECYIISEDYQEIPVSRGSIAAYSAAIMLSMCVLASIIISSGSELL